MTFTSKRFSPTYRVPRLLPSCASTTQCSGAESGISKPRQNGQTHLTSIRYASLYYAVLKFATGSARVDTGWNFEVCSHNNSGLSLSLFSSISSDLGRQVAILKCLCLFRVTGYFLTSSVFRSLLPKCLHIDYCQLS